MFRKNRPSVKLVRMLYMGCIVLCTCLIPENVKSPCIMNYVLLLLLLFFAVGNSRRNTVLSRFCIIICWKGFVFFAHTTVNMCFKYIYSRMNELNQIHVILCIYIFICKFFSHCITHQWLKILSNLYLNCFLYLTKEFLPDHFASFLSELSWCSFLHSFFFYH